MTCVGIKCILALTGSQFLLRPVDRAAWRLRSWLSRGERVNLSKKSAIEAWRRYAVAMIPATILAVRSTFGAQGMVSWNRKGGG